jgi:hypothetical protein
MRVVNQVHTCQSISFRRMKLDSMGEVLIMEVRTPDGIAEFNLFFDTKEKADAAIQGLRATVNRD